MDTKIVDDSSNLIDVLNHIVNVSRETRKRKAAKEDLVKHLLFLICDFFLGKGRRIC